MYKTFDQSDFGSLFKTDCGPYLVKTFLQTVNNPTLGKRVADALQQREQGHFNGAVAGMTEVNRDQVMAIRELQAILDKLAGQPATAIVLENFRQTPPLQLGLTNGERVLELLTAIKSGFQGDYTQTLNDLHLAETELDSLNEEYTFFSERMPGRLSASELDDLKNKVLQQSDKLLDIKKVFLDNIISYLSVKYNDRDGDDLINMIKCLYIILTSSVETLDAKLVKI